MTAVSPLLSVSCQVLPFQDILPESHESWGSSPSHWQSHSSTAQRWEQQNQNLWFRRLDRMKSEGSTQLNRIKKNFHFGGTLILECRVGTSKCKAELTNKTFNGCDILRYLYKIIYLSYDLLVTTGESPLIKWPKLNVCQSIYRQSISDPESSLI